MPFRRLRIANSGFSWGYGDLSREKENAGIGDAIFSVGTSTLAVAGNTLESFWIRRKRRRS